MKQATQIKERRFPNRRWERFENRPSLNNTSPSSKSFRESCDEAVTEA